MEALLRWLYNHAYRVYEFFSTLYHKIKTTAIGAWDWIEDKARAIYEWTIQTVTYWYNRAVAGAQALVNGVIDLAWVLYNRAVEAAQAIFDGVIDLVWVIYNRAVAAAQALFNAAIDLIWFAFNRAVEAAQEALAGMVLVIQAVIDRAHQAALAIINGVIDAIDAQMKRMGIVDPESENQLRLFLEKPLSFMAAYMVSLLLTMLDVEIAYALGAVEATLPPPPDWEGGAGGGPGPEGGILAPPLTRLYRSGYRYGPGHRGADFGCTQDMNVYACHDGKVLVAGWSPVGYGNYVVIGNGEWWSLYAHLLHCLVSTGQRVSARDSIGVCDTTGNSTGNHLHLEIKHYGAFINPYTMFGVEG